MIEKLSFAEKWREDGSRLDVRLGIDVFYGGGESISGGELAG